MSTENIFLSQSIEFAASESNEGTFAGVAYTGAVIKRHGFYENLVIDLDTFKFNKSKQIPIFRDHQTSQIAGYGNVDKVDGQILVQGKRSDATPHGREIKDLATEGFKWQMSVGIDGIPERLEDGVVNGHKVKNGWVIRNAEIKEVSFVALGADSKTKVKVFKQQDIEEAKEMPELSKEQWIAFACACGGDKNSSTEDMESKFKSLKNKSDKLEEEKSNLEKELAEIKKKLNDAAKKDRKATIQKALDDKKIKMSDEKVTSAAETEVGFKTLLGLIGDMEVEKKNIKDEFSRSLNFDGNEKPEPEGDDLMLAAEELVKAGKANDLFQALELAQKGGK